MKARTVPALLVPTARAMPWALFLAAAGLGLVIVAGPAVSTVSLRDEDLLGLLRVAAACGAVGIAFLLDDPAARSIATVPTPRLLRHLLRAALAAAVAGAWWAALLGATVAGAEDGAAATLRLGGVTIEAAALAATALALAAARLRMGDGAAGLLAGPGVLVLATAAVLLPARWALYVPPGDDRWAAAHGRWALLLAAALIALLWAGRDPVHRRGH
ncbi:hypothetical protein ACTMTJ_07960 [Phytohabitans sp. LJ34]|uniref:hypothetical protein n=1 Tax=Phytohabitans sp. LJ34 TaxID=3452217 RepID=UPI003F8C2CBA